MFLIKIVSYACVHFWNHRIHFGQIFFKKDYLRNLENITFFLGIIEFNNINLFILYSLKNICKLKIDNYWKND